MIDLLALFRTPKMMLFGAAAPVRDLLHRADGAAGAFDLPTRSIGIIGAAERATSIYVASRFAKSGWSHLVAAYSYYVVVPIIQPPIIRLLTRAERCIAWTTATSACPSRLKVIFPIAITIISGVVAPASVRWSAV